MKIWITLQVKDRAIFAQLPENTDICFLHEAWSMKKENLLFRKMQEGDWHAFNAFFECYAEQLYHYALGFVKQRAVAEDIIQDIFIYLWVKRDKINCTDSIYAYLCRSVKNACIDYKLHEQVEQRYRQEMAAQGPDKLNTEDDFEELYKRLQEFITALPEKCREVFILGCVEGKNYREIAGQLGISVNTVKTQIKIAYKKAKDEFGEPGGNLILLLYFPFFKEEGTEI